MTTPRKPDPIDVDRDLRFFPADPEAARTLSAAQVRGFNENGFVSGLDLLDPAEVHELRTYFDALIEDVVNAPDRRNAYSINCYHLVCERLYDLVTDVRILDRVEDLLGPDFVCWGSHLFAKLPGDPKEVPLHQDGVYWPWTPSRTVTVWLAIDDADEGNAAMQFVPGSHRLGELPHDVLALDGTRVLGRRVSNADAYTNRFTNELRAGQMSLHSDLLLHGSGTNRSSRRRAGMTLRYAASDVRLVEGYEHWRKTAVCVRGKHPGDFWYDRRRPVGEHPERMADLWGEFDGQPMDAS